MTLTWAKATIALGRENLANLMPVMTATLTTPIKISRLEIT
jgi:hypothetical protein